LVSWCRNRFFLFLSLSSLTLVPHQQNGELSWVINEDRNCNKFAIGTALNDLERKLKMEELAMIIYKF
jgi:hypothetical protein